MSGPSLVVGTITDEYPMYGHDGYRRKKRRRGFLEASWLPGGAVRLSRTRPD